MRIITLFLIIILFPIKSIGQIEKLSEDEISYFGKMAYDININVYNGNFSNQKDFWSYVKNSNKGLRKYENRNSKLKRKTKEKIDSYMLKYDIIERNYHNSKELDHIFDFVKFSLFGTDKIENKFLVSDEFNAYVSVNGSFYLGKKLAEILTPEEIVFVMAHEYAHFLMKHIEIRMYSNLKTKRKNDIIAGISEAAFAAGYMYAASQVRYNNNDDFSDSYMNTIRGIDNIADGYTVSIR